MTTLAPTPFSSTVETIATLFTVIVPEPATIRHQLRNGADCLLTPPTAGLAQVAHYLAPRVAAVAASTDNWLLLEGIDGLLAQAGSVIFIADRQLTNADRCDLAAWVAMMTDLRARLAGVIDSPY